MFSVWGSLRRLCLSVVLLLAVGLLAVVPPTAHADQCAPPGEQSASALPTNLAAAAAGPKDDKYTTTTTQPLSAVDVDRLVRAHVHGGLPDWQPS